MINTTKNKLKIGDSVQYETLFDPAEGGPHFIPGKIIKIEEDRTHVTIRQRSGATLLVDGTWCEKI